MNVNLIGKMGFSISLLLIGFIWGARNIITEAEGVYNYNINLMLAFCVFIISIILIKSK